MDFIKCYNKKCKWLYARKIGGFTDYMCTWRRFNALAVNRYGEQKILTPGRLIRIEKMKACPLDNNTTKQNTSCQSSVK